MPKLPLAVPKNLITYKSYFLLFAAIYFLIPIFLFYFSQSYIVYYVFVFAWCAPFLFVVILLCHIEDRENYLLSKQRRPRSSIQFIYQKHYSPERNPRLAPVCGAEIGVGRGEHALDMLNYLNLEKLYLIDPWERYNDHGVEGFPEDNWEESYQFVRSMFSDYENVEIIREKSIDASELIEDSTLDFVYIDANHEYEYVLADLRTWYSKLKRDGVLCGDDFGAPSSVGLIRAVTEFAYENRILVMSKTNQF